MMTKEWDEMSHEEQLKATFDKFFARFGQEDFVVWGFNIACRTCGYHRVRCYHDGDWLEGYDIEPVIYWGA